MRACGGIVIVVWNTHGDAISNPGPGISHNENDLDEFIMKVDIKSFGYKNLFQDSKFMKNVVKIAMDVWWNNWIKESV